ncbi:MAG: response regulator [Elusimicrobiota bacterium]
MNVLVAEDDALSRKMLERVLVDSGHHVCAVGGSTELLAVCGRCAYELVLSDIHFGADEADGIAACLRILRDHPGLGIVMMTADPDDARRAQAAGFAEVLLKPFTVDQLFAALDRAARSRRASAGPDAVLPIRPY